MSEDIFYNDPIGKAVSDYNDRGKAGKLLVHSMQFDDDEIPVSHLFRSFEKMPQLEQVALKHVKGKVLDVGACAGSHTLELQNSSVNVDALEKSHACCQVMQHRGVNNVINADIYNYKQSTYDTILLLMNGAGIGESLENFGHFLEILKSLLNPEGQILMDSSDLKFLYEEDDGSYLFNLNDNYYGEIDFQMEYQGLKSDWFSWLYIDAELLKIIAREHGLNAEIIAEGEHYDYLARLTQIANSPL